MVTAFEQVTRNQALRWLGDVPTDKVFYCCNGEVYRNLSELESALERMQDEHFVYHVNVEKNDFSNWVRHVIGTRSWRMSCVHAAVVQTSFAFWGGALVCSASDARRHDLRQRLPRDR